MRVLFAAALLLLLLPATATAATDAVTLSDAEYCRDATRDDPYVFQASCWTGSMYCTPWISYWDPFQGHAMGLCGM